MKKLKNVEEKQDVDLHNTVVQVTFCNLPIPLITININNNIFGYVEEFWNSKPLTHGYGYLTRRLNSGIM